MEAVCPPARLPFPGEGRLGQPRVELGLASRLLCAQASLPLPRQPSPRPELALRICAVVCRTQGDRPLLSKVSLARIQVTVLLPHPAYFHELPRTLGREDKILGVGLWLPLEGLLV